MFQVKSHGLFHKEKSFQKKKFKKKNHRAPHEVLTKNDSDRHFTNIRPKAT